MTKSIRNAFIQIWLWKKDLRAILAIALGIGIICYEGYPYLKYAAFVRSNIQACELYILCGSTGYIYLGLFLGYLLLMSNAPFIDRMASFEIVRFGRKRWIDSKILYIILGCFTYSVILLIVTMIFSAINGQIYFGNEWSYAISELAIRKPAFAITVYKIMFPFEDLILSVDPYTAVILTVIFNSMYSITICMLIMCFNIISRHNMGWIIAISIHIGGYIIYANSTNMFPQSYSIFCHSLPALYFEKEMVFSLIGSLSFGLLTVLLLREFSAFLFKKREI